MASLISRSFISHPLISRALLALAGASLATGALAQNLPTEQDAPIPVIRLSPQVRTAPLASSAVPVISAAAIEPFLAEAMIVEKNEIDTAPRIVAAPEGRVLLSRGDRAYARGTYTEGQAGGAALAELDGKQQDFRIFRNATPLADPTTGEVLGYEIQYIGKATLVRGESSRTVLDKLDIPSTEVTPATIDIVASKEEIRVGDRLLPEPARELLSFAPHAPTSAVAGQVLSIYGHHSVALASANQIVVLNKGARDGLERGHILAILKKNDFLRDKTDPTKTTLKLPTERNGLMMVFRSFANLSYALILEITDGVRVGDRFANP